MISVIIPTYNRATMVCDCVASVLATNYPDLEVIVVDDCSPDDTSTRLAERFGNDPRVKLIRNERNSFQAVSRNNGARLAKGEYLFFLDDDNLVHPEIFTELLAAFDAQPNAGLVAPLAIHMRRGKTGVIWSLGSDFNRWTSQPKDTHPNLPLADFDTVPRCVPARGATSASVPRAALGRGVPKPPTAPLIPATHDPDGVVVPRAVLAPDRGVADEHAPIFEESDFGWKIMEAGFKCFIATRARTDHLGFLEPGCVPALRQLGIEKPRRTYCFARNRLRFARRHFSWLQALCVTLIFAPLSAVYYGAVALKNRRPDIAGAYLKGTLAGIFGL